jgi:hypothetical protein
MSRLTRMQGNGRRGSLSPPGNSTLFCPASPLLSEATAKTLISSGMWRQRSPEVSHVPSRIHGAMWSIMPLFWNLPALPAGGHALSGLYRRALRGMSSPLEVQSFSPRLRCQDPMICNACNPVLSPLKVVRACNENRTEQMSQTMRLVLALLCRRRLVYAPSESARDVCIPPGPMRYRY